MSISLLLFVADCVLKDLLPLRVLDVERVEDLERTAGHEPVGRQVDDELAQALVRALAPNLLEQGADPGDTGWIPHQSTSSRENRVPSAGGLGGSQMTVSGWPQLHRLTMSTGSATTSGRSKSFQSRQPRHVTILDSVFATTCLSPEIGRASCRERV